MSKVFLTSSPAQTVRLAGSLLPLVIKKRIVCLYGELGSGKTTFVQGLAKALRIKQPIQSPSFVLVKEYPVKNRKLVHIDCYRLKSNKDFRAVDLQEICQDKNSLVVIEWADRLKTALSGERLDLTFEYEAENKRKITLI